MEMEKKLQKCQQNIQTVFGKDFTGLDVTQPFYWPAVSIVKHDIEWSTKHYMKVSLKQLFNNRNQYLLHRSKDSRLLFFSNSNRDDHAAMFKKAVSCASFADVVQIEVTPKQLAKLSDCILRIKRLLRWCINKQKCDLAWREFWFLVPFVQLSLEAKKQFEQWPLEKYKAIIMLHDLNWISDPLRQMADKKGVFTVSLQHGSPLVHNVFPEEGEDICLRMSNAKRLLVWSELNKIRAIEAGVPEKNIVVCGNLRYLGCIRKPMKKGERKGNFTVILSLFRYENIRLTQIAVELAKITGWKFYLRYHPLEQGNEYNKYCQTENYLGNARKFSIQQCQDETDFFLVGCSSMLLDVLFAGARAYHYCDERGYGAFPISECTFSDAQDVIRLENNLENTEKDWNSMQNKLLGPIDAEQRYKAFFSMLDNDL